jgi:hypothetical protein
MSGSRYLDGGNQDGRRFEFRVAIASVGVRLLERSWEAGVCFDFFFRFDGFDRCDFTDCFILCLCL